MAPFKGDLDRHVRPGNEAGPYATTPIRAATQKCAAGFGDGLFPPERSRRLSADPAALSRGGRTGTCRLTTREPVTVCRHNLGGRPEAAAGAAVFPGRTANLAPPERPTGWPSDACRRHIGLAEYPVYDPQTGVARDPRVTEAAMCVRLVDVRITCGLHDDAQIAAVFIDPRAKFTYGNLVTTFTSSKRPSSVIFPVARRPSPRGGRITRVQSEDLTAVVQSVVATGGVYKGQGRNQRELMTRAYWEFLVHVENCKPRSLSTKEVQRVTRKPVGPGMLTHADSFSVARVRPRTSKGITDLLSLSLVRLFSSAACPSKKSLSSWEPAVALVTYRDPPATAANAARFTTEPQARQTHADQG
ncbi:hypothetical protein KEM48_014629 [Puccinia striiformis f. sp. tritici PST-130]|nr:hypothetical protein KEM48_014629 [Puccinia striiformis f. sp. tritici PST-130]